MWSSVELQELRIFLTLAEEQHFGRTAERLMLSQARVSQATRVLERKLGGRLFDRTSRTVRLTAFGESVRDDVGDAYELLQQALRRAHHRSGAVVGTVKLGIYGNALNAGPHLTAIIRAFTAAYPDCRVDLLDVGSMADSLAPLRNGEIDLVTARLPLDQPDITIGPVLAHQMRVLLVNRQDPLAQREAIDYDEIGERLVGTLNPALPRSSAMPSFRPSLRPADNFAGPMGSSAPQPRPICRSLSAPSYMSPSRGGRSAITTPRS